MAAKKKNSTEAAQTKTTAVVGINIGQMVIDNLKAAQERLNSITVDLSLLDVDILAASLAENIIIIADDVDNHLVTVVQGKRSATVDAKRQLGDITIELLAKLIEETVALVESTGKFGNTTLSVKSLKSIRVLSEKIKEDSFQLFISAILYKVRNPS